VAPNSLSLTIGTQIGSHKITALLGRGGMGEVYRAWDSNLKRDVAIKVLSEEHSRDAEGEARFRREAEVLASLNHSNIAAIYDAGQLSDSRYLVLELVEGDTLGDRIRRGPLPFPEALQIAQQIASALDAAHEKGIVHRDLKPANIKIRRDGAVKILDFGLAKFVSEPTAGDIENAPTLSGTRVGVILGTPAYMSPEQARGKPTDKRADIWAFGVVFYEMLTGRPAFTGEDLAATVAAVLQTEPRWNIVPSNARKLLENCLEKDPQKRLRDIGDAWKLLDSPPLESPARAGLSWKIAAGTLAVVAALSLWPALRSPTRPVAQPATRLEVDLGQEVSLLPLYGPTFSSLIISPDGTRLAYVASVSGSPQKLFSHRLDQSRPVELPGTEGAINPFFSPDGKWVAFFNGKRLAKVPVDGGAIVPLLDIDVMTGGDWADAGSLIVGTGVPNPIGLIRVPAAGGPSTPLLTLTAGDLFSLLPHTLPGGQSVLFTSVGTPPRVENSNIEVLTLSDSQRKTLVRGAVASRYVESGHVLYVNKATLFAVPFDIQDLETHGTAVAVLDDVAFDPYANGAQYDVSRNGTLVYRKSVEAPMRRIFWIETAGKRTPISDKSGPYVGAPRVSPDGKRFAMAIRDGADQHVWIYDIQREAMSRLTSGGGVFANPIWSNDGGYVILSETGTGILWVRADGAGAVQTLVPGQTPLIPMSFGPNGKKLLYNKIDGSPQIWSVDIEDSAGSLRASHPVRFLTTPHQDADPMFSLDGQWIAYDSNESGKFEVYVRGFSPTAVSTEAKWQISSGGGALPAWSPNGRELLYRSGDQIMSVSYLTREGAFIAEKPRVWASNLNGASGFSFTPDGKRILISLPTASPERRTQEHTIMFIQNFFDELRRLAPAGR
jgi:serine/threonine protein kinase